VWVVPKQRKEDQNPPSRHWFRNQEDEWRSGSIKGIAGAPISEVK